MDVYSLLIFFFILFLLCVEFLSFFKNCIFSFFMRFLKIYLNSALDFIIKFVARCRLIVFDAIFSFFTVLLFFFLLYYYIFFTVLLLFLFCGPDSISCGMGSSIFDFFSRKPRLIKLYKDPTKVLSTAITLRKWHFEFE